MQTMQLSHAKIKKMKIGDYVCDVACGMHGIIVGSLLCEGDMAGKTAWCVLYEDGDLDYVFEDEVEVVSEVER